MAVWHFKFDMIPTRGIERALGRQASVLEEYQARDDGPSVLPDVPNYWGDTDLMQFESRLAEILPQEPWSGKGPRR